MLLLCENKDMTVKIVSPRMKRPIQIQGDHQGPLDNDDPNNKESRYNKMVEWKTVEITEECLSIIAADEPVTCAAYAKNITC